MLSLDLLELLRAWWRAGREAGVMLPGGWLFPGQNPVNPLTTRQLNRMFHAAKAAAEIDKPVNLHSLRHCFATQGVRKPDGHRGVGEAGTNPLTAGSRKSLPRRGMKRRYASLALIRHGAAWAPRNGARESLRLGCHERLKRVENQSSLIFCDQFSAK